MLCCWLRIRALALNSSPHHDLIAHRLLFYPLLGLPMIMISCVESCVDMVAVSNMVATCYMLRSELGFSLYGRKKKPLRLRRLSLAKKIIDTLDSGGLIFFQDSLLASRAANGLMHDSRDLM